MRSSGHRNRRTQHAPHAEVAGSLAILRDGLEHGYLFDRSAAEIHPAATHCIQSRARRLIQMQFWKHSKHQGAGNFLLSRLPRRTFKVVAILSMANVQNKVSHERNARRLLQQDDNRGCAPASGESPFRDALAPAYCGRNAAPVAAPRPRGAANSPSAGAKRRRSGRAGDHGELVAIGHAAVILAPRHFLSVGGEVRCSDGMMHADSARRRREK